MIIYLVRHTKPDVAENTCYGQSNIGVIDQTFQQEVLRMRAILPVSKWGTIYTSPLKRCLCLAKELARATCRIRTDNRLKELNFGKWELQKWDDIDDKQMIDWGQNYIEKSPPEGESFAQLYNRSVEFWEELISKRHSMAAVFTHGGVMKSILTHILEMPLKKSFTFHLNYGEIIKIDTNENNMYQVEFLSSSKNC